MFVQVRGTEYHQCAKVPSQFDALQFIRDKLKDFDGNVVATIRNTRFSKPLMRLTVNVGYTNRELGIHYSVDPSGMGGHARNAYTDEEQAYRCQLRNAEDFVNLVNSLTCETVEREELRKFGQFAIFQNGSVLGYLPKGGAAWLIQNGTLRTTYAKSLVEAVRFVLTNNM